MKELAQRLINLEATNRKNDKVEINSASQVLEKLRLLLSRFSGLDGFSALMRRALAVSRMDNPALEGCTLGKDGSLASLEGISEEVGLSLASQLLELMATFIGESLTISLVKDTWPENEEKVD